MSDTNHRLNKDVPTEGEVSSIQLNIMYVTPRGRVIRINPNCYIPVWFSSDGKENGYRAVTNDKGYIRSYTTAKDAVEFIKQYEKWRKENNGSDGWG